MVAGHLQEKKGYYYAVLNYKDNWNNRKTKWIPTGILAKKGNKKSAEIFLMEQRVAFVPADDTPQTLVRNELFADYLRKWLNIAKSTIAITTYSSYSGLITSAIDPWFRKRKITLEKLTAHDIQAFYTEQLERVCPNTVIHYHAVIHRALKYAVKTDLLPTNPADKVDRPKKNSFQASFYDGEEINSLFRAVEGTIIEVPVKLTAFYGLRRSEVLGLKWEAIDFNRGTISIQHTVTTCMVDGKHVIIDQDTTKTKSSRRTLPLTLPMREMLLRHQKRQIENRLLCGNCYRKEYLDYVCLNDVGRLIAPNQLTGQFSQMLRRHHLRIIRFHDLRHSSASLLLANGVPLKQIQEWLGHSDFSTTANIYAHLDHQSKQRTADAMMKSLGIG